MKYTFTLCLLLSALFCWAQPANDNLCNATPITVGTACTDIPNIDTDAATAEVNEPDFQAQGFFGDTLALNSVWYSFVAPASEIFIVAGKDVPGLDGTFKMALFSLNGDCSDLTNLVPVTNAYATTNLRSAPVIQTTLEAGATYYIQISGVDLLFPPDLFSGQGCLTIEEVGTPANDDVCDAANLMINDTARIFNNLGATAQDAEAALTPPGSPADFFALEPGNWAFGAPLNNSVWFSFTTPDSVISVDIDLSGSTLLPGSFNSQVAIYEAGDCNDLSTFSLVNAQDNFFPPAIGLFSLTINPNMEVFCLQPNTTYYVAVDGGNSLFFNPIADQGYFSIQVRQKVLEPLAIRSILEGPDCPGDSNGSILTGAVGGAGVYTYEWSNGDSLPYLTDQIGIDETFRLTVTDRCNEQIVESFTLTAPLLGMPALEATTPINACLGEEITLNAMASGGLLADTNRLFTEVSSASGNSRLLSRELLRPGSVTSLNDSTGVSLIEYEFVGDQLYGVGFENDLHAVDPVTGVLTFIDTLELASVSDLSYSPNSGKLYVTSQEGIIYELTPSDGSLKQIADLGLFVDGGVVFVADGSDQLFFHNFDSLYNYDIANQTLTSLVPSFGSYLTLGITGIELDPSDNTIYAGISSAVTQETPGFMEFSKLNPADGTFSDESIDLSGSGRVRGFAIKDRDRTPYAYQWMPSDGLDDATTASPGLTVAGPATYTLMITDACGLNATTTVEVAPFPTDTTIIDTTVLAGTSFGPDMIMISTDTVLYATVLGGGTNGCNSVTQTNISVTTTSVWDTWPGKAIQLSPNPAKDQLFIQTQGIEEKEVQYFVRDLYGRVLQMVSRQGVRQHINIDHLVPGQYYLEVRSTNKQAIRKFVKY